MLVVELKKAEMMASASYCMHKEGKLTLQSMSHVLQVESAVRQIPLQLRQMAGKFLEPDDEQDDVCEAISQPLSHSMYG